MGVLVSGDPEENGLKLEDQPLSSSYEVLPVKLDKS